MGLALCAAPAAAQPGLSAPPPAATTQNSETDISKMSGVEKSRRAAEYGKLAVNAWDREDYESAKRLMDNALLMNPTQPEATLVLGLFLIKTNRPREAFEPLDRYLKTTAGKNDYRGYEALGDLALRSNYAQWAIRNFKQALDKAPAKTGKVRADIQMKYAQALGMGGQFTEAVAMANEAITGLPRSAEYQWELARIQMRASKDDDALRAIEASARLSREQFVEFAAVRVPEIVPVQKKLGLLKDVLDAAVTIREQAVQKGKGDPATAGLALGRARVDQAKNEYNIKIAAAVAILMASAKIDPKNAEIWAELAKNELDLGLRANAMADATAALAINPNNTTAKEVRSRIAGGSMDSVAPPIKPPPASAPAMSDSR
ncbi:MAG: tetratricopeptide repeat protein [Phycisphaerae bacterium]